MKTFLVILLVLAFVLPSALFYIFSRSELRLDPPVPAIGAATPIRLRIENPGGIRRITAAIHQGGASHKVFETTEPANRFFFLRKRLPPRIVSFTAGHDRTPDLKDGKARLRIETEKKFFYLSKKNALESEVDIITQPPKLAVDTAQHYINQGGSELVSFSVSGYQVESGVKVAQYSFRSFAKPGKRPQSRFSLFAFPWDVPATTTPVVYARNPANEVTGRFWHKVFPKKFRSRDLVIDDAFLEKVVNQIDPKGTGDLLSRFLEINGTMRRRNNQTLADLRLKTEERFLWTGPFLQLANSKVESQFADRRSYIYKGKKVDEQVHLGFDLSVTKNIPVVAANDGKVLYAADLGIYGNCIVVDHGYGLQSIYGHLSEIGVKPGDPVKKNQPMGKSGSTGLAGGDHLHFSMQLDGVQISPVEWWDEHWIRDRILSKLTDSAEPQPSAVAK